LFIAAEVAAARPVDVGDSGYPGGAEFTRCRRRFTAQGQDGGGALAIIADGAGAVLTLTGGELQALSMAMSTPASNARCSGDFFEQKRMRLKRDHASITAKTKKSCDATAFVLHKPAFIRCICILPLFFEKP
jgi:hypothetical protein